MLLPDEIKLGPEWVVVQPDASIISPSTYVLVEAKRIRPSSFQAHQLPRELVALVSQAGARSPLLLLVLKEPPPVPVAGLGRLSLHDALTLDLPAVLAKTPEVNATMHDLVERLPDIVAWITWGRDRRADPSPARLVPRRSIRSSGDGAAPDRRGHPSDRMARLSRPSRICQGGASYRRDRAGLCRSLKMTR